VSIDLAVRKLLDVVLGVIFAGQVSIVDLRTVLFMLLVVVHHVVGRSLCLLCGVILLRRWLAWRRGRGRVLRRGVEHGRLLARG
jgi:hypothetical protein